MQPKQSAVVPDEKPKEEPKKPPKKPPVWPEPIAEPEVYKARKKPKPKKDTPKKRSDS